MTLPTAIVISILMCALTFEESTEFISFAIAGSIAYILLEFNARFAFIRTQTFLPASMFLVFYAGCPSLHEYNSEIFIPLLFSFSTLSMFASYDRANSPINTFNAFFCLGIMSIILPYMLYLLPIMYICMMSLRCFNLRTFLAGLLGIGALYGIMASYHYIDNGNAAVVAQYIAPIVEHPFQAPFRLIAYEDALYFGGIIAIGLIASIMCSQYAYKDKVRTRILMRTIIIAEVALLLLVFVQPATFYAVMTMEMMIGALMCGHLFSLEFNRFTLIFLYSAITLLIATSVLNIWIQLYNS